MRAVLIAMTALSGLASPVSVSAARASVQNAWLYSTADKPKWCAFKDSKGANAAAKSGTFDSGESAWLRYHGDVIDSVTIMTESEDAYVEDTYTFDAKLRLTQVVRRGHYIASPFFSVTFVPNQAGELRLTPSSETVKRQQEQNGHETYFIDWLLYPNFAKLPFSSLVKTRSKIIVFSGCVRTPAEP